MTPSTQKRSAQRGVTLIEMVIAVTLMSLLSVGIVISLRVALSAMNKTDNKLMSNRRVASVERILQQQIAGIMPVTAECQATGEVTPARVVFFQGETATMRMATSFSLQEGSRGMSVMLEYQVIPGEDGQGVRLVVNEHLYTGPRGAGMFCTGVAPDPSSPTPVTRFIPVQIGGGSFVLADKLAYCRFSYRELIPPAEPKWVLRWVRPALPTAIRVEMEPLIPDASRLQPVTLTLPVRVNRLPLERYDN
jgi:prepilin-type N-terminal cleavage/methylation domain-containing protein